MPASAQEIVERFVAMRSARAPYERDWEEIAGLLRPIGKGFASKLTEGQRRHVRIYDSSPLMALEHFKAGLFSSVTPRTTQWFEVQHMDEDLNEFGPVKEYFRIVSKRAWKSFGPGVSKFYTNAPPAYANLGAFGTACMYSAEAENMRIFDRTRALAEIYIDTNDEDEVDTVFRYFRLTARAITMGKTAQGQPWTVSPAIARAAAKPETAGEKFWIIHAVYPAKDLDYGMRWRGCYVAEADKALLGEEGFFEFPFFVPRWDVTEGERYGRGCGHVALADIKSINITRRSNLNLLDRMARPTLLAHSEIDIGGAAQPYPGETVFGAITQDGKRLIAPLEEGKNAQTALEQEKMIRDAIKDAFYWGLMQIVGSYDMTATEWIGRDEERQQLTGPYLGNLETELLSPYVKRRVGILERAGQLPPMPRELEEAGGSIEVRYIGLAARLARLKEGEGVVKAIGALTAAAQVAPGVVDRIDPDDLAEAISEGFGTDFLTTREVAQQIRDDRDQRQQAMAIAEQAPGVAGAVKDVADAAAMVKGMKGQAAATLATQRAAA